MANEIDTGHDSVGAWAKRYYVTGRALVDSILRPYDLGWTQWHVLNVLANQGPSIQRDLGVFLEIERPTISGVITALVRKGFVDQAPDVTDQRQRMLQLTDAGKALWDTLPNPIELVLTIAFDDADDADLAIARRVLQDATRRLVRYQEQGTQE